MILEKVTIVIVTYNAVSCIEQAINSVLNQQYSNLELIVVDGASTDGTVDVVNGFGDGINHFVSEPDKGIYDAMNKGINIATGRWLLFLGADDILCDGILNRIFANNSYQEEDLLYGKVSIKGSSKSIGTTSTFEQLIENNIPHQAIFYKDEVLAKMKGYNTRYKILADYDLNLRIFRNGKIKTHYINEEVAIFNKDGISNTTIDTLFFKDKLSYFISECGLCARDKRLAKYYFLNGEVMMLKKQYKNGVANMLHPLIYGGKRFHFFLLTARFILAQTGLLTKYKYT